MPYQCSWRGSGDSFPCWSLPKPCMCALWLQPWGWIMSLGGCWSISQLILALLDYSWVLQKLVYRWAIGQPTSRNPSQLSFPNRGNHLTWLPSHSGWLVNGKGIHTPRGLVKGIWGVRVRVWIFVPSIYPYPWAGVQGYAQPQTRIWKHMILI